LKTLTSDVDLVQRHIVCKTLSDENKRGESKLTLHKIAERDVGDVRF